MIREHFVTKLLYRSFLTFYNQKIPRRIQQIPIPFRIFSHLLTRKVPRLFSRKISDLLQKGEAKKAPLVCVSARPFQSLNGFLIPGSSLSLSAEQKNAIKDEK